MSVNPSQFEEFFRAVYGFDPFPWQKRLAQRVIGGLETNPWPQCLALPTASGKTACLDIATFALACQAEMPPAERTAPRRIIFVVDRRVIVDEAFEHAVELAKLLCTSEEPILKNVADALRTIAGHQQLVKLNPTFEEAVPLTCHQLRGGIYRDDAWARTPTQPCVIASTVDQIGSRILFRSYGRSNRTWPVHAGLAGNDSLIILDEAHCANAFFQTMQWISRYRSEQWAEVPLRCPFHFVVMSATPPKDDVENEITDILRDEQDDRDHPVLGRRISTSKRVALTIAGKVKGRNWKKELAVEFVKSAFSLVSEERLAIALLVNRVDTAKLIDQLLALILDSERPVSQPFDERTVKSVRKLLPEGCNTFDHVLMTGRMRPLDKERVTDEWLARLKANPNRDPEAPAVLDLSRPVFVTATQCLEVGANLDFDAMVSECASLDALRQRFGRLNRIGRWDSAPGIIVIRGDQTPAKTPDPVYGESLAATWQWLHDGEDTEEGPLVDFGISRMNETLEALDDAIKSSLVLRGPDAPVMLPAHVDCWVQTEPEPSPSPDVSLFLRGPRSGPPEIRVCWREDVTVSELQSRRLEVRERDFREAVALCPPTSRECLPVPLNLFLRWLSESDDADVDTEGLTDVESTLDGDAVKVYRSKRAMTLIWRGATDDSRLVTSRNDLRPGDTVVIPADLGGWDVFGHRPQQSPIDVAEVCHMASRRQPILRICPALVSGWDIADSEKEALDSAIKGEDGDPDWDAIVSIIEELLDAQTAGPSFLQLLQHWKFLRRRKRERHPFGGLVLRGPRMRLKDIQTDNLRTRITTGETYTTEDDTSSEAQRTISLPEHLEGVKSHADLFAGLAGLDAKVGNSMKLAGRLHDLGKADPRFQAMLHGGQYLRAQLFGHLLAKSQGLPVTPDDRKSASQRSRLPEGFRHELLSLQIVEHFRELLDGSIEIDPDLVLHLVGAHHGQGRPFATVVVDDLLTGGSRPEVDDLIALRFEFHGREFSVSASQRRHWTPPHRLDSGIAHRFWKLVRRYGWWGLAWLEAMFILADHRQSEFEGTLLELNEQHAEATT